MSAIYERSQMQLDDFVHAMPQCVGQVGAVFSISGQIAGVDAFDFADTFAKAAPEAIRSYARIDAMESPAAAGTNGVASAGAVPCFLDNIGGANTTRFKALGLGDDLRLNGLRHWLGPRSKSRSRSFTSFRFRARCIATNKNEHPRRSQNGNRRVRRTFH